MTDRVFAIKTTAAGRVLVFPPAAPATDPSPRKNPVRSPCRLSTDPGAHGMSRAFPRGTGTTRSYAGEIERRMNRSSPNEPWHRRDRRDRRAVLSKRWTRRDPRARGARGFASRGITLAVLMLVSAAAAFAAPASGHSREAGLSLLDVVGLVSGVEVTRGVDGTQWVDAAVTTSTRGTVRIRLAPRDILDREGFLLRRGDSVRARVFGDESPHEVHRIQNETTGTSIRLRCLHGDPLWDSRASGRGRERWRGGR